jgi:hypothetical protein
MGQAIEVKDACKYCKNERGKLTGGIYIWSQEIEPCNTCRYNTRGDWKHPHIPYGIHFEEKEGD